MDANEIVDFLAERSKFTLVQGGFTVDTSKNLQPLRLKIIEKLNSLLYTLELNKVNRL